MSKLAVIGKAGKLPLGADHAAPAAEEDHVWNLLETEQALRHAIENAIAAGIAMVDRDGRLSYVNQSFCKMVGWSEEDLLGSEQPFPYWPAEEIHSIQKAFAEVKDSGNSRNGLELRFRRRNGERFLASLTITPVADSGVSGGGWVLAVSDITERRNMERALAHNAAHDPVTGLPNRLLYEEHLRQALARARRSGRSLALLRLDVDRFRMIDHTIGRSAGDVLLRHVAQRLKGCLRDSEILTRNEGDKFTVILSDLEAPQVGGMVAQRMIDGLSQPFLTRGHEVFLTASIGIALFPRDGDDVAELERNADSAMYAAKKQGKNRFQVFTPEMNETATHRLSLETELHHALDRKEVMLHYQPQFDLRTGRVAGVEALLRWENQKFGRIPASLVVSIAEETGLILPVGRWVVNEACRQASAWRTAGYAPMKMGINISAIQFAREDLTGIVSSALQEHGLLPSCLDLEVTESVIMEDAAESCRHLKELKRLGVSISLDDFGTGYSSLSYLQQFPIDMLKIDRTFIQKMNGAERTWTLVDAIIGLAHSLGMQATAEGVQNEHQIGLLKSMGCDYAQSFFLARPGAPKRIADLLEKNSGAVSEHGKVSDVA
ncbi:MAG: EAL domain-containing protein [Bryobacteraceae bacterium]